MMCAEIQSTIKQLKSQLTGNKNQTADKYHLSNQNLQLINRKEVKSSFLLTSCKVQTEQKNKTL